MSKPTFEEKVQKEFPDFVAEVQGLQVDGLNAKLLGYAKYAEEVNEMAETNAALKAAKEALSMITGPINSTKKALRTKMRYIAIMIKEKGGA